MKETYIQQAFIKTMRYRENTDQRFSVIAIPNEAKRSIATASRMKAEGLTAGTWDLLLLTPAHGFGGLWLECKTADGVLSPSQREFYEKHNGKYQFSIFRDHASGIRLVEEYLLSGFGNYAGGTGIESKLKKVSLN